MNICESNFTCLEMKYLIFEHVKNEEAQKNKEKKISKMERLEESKM